MNAYNVVVVGSDEVWNLFHPWYGKCPFFFGDGVRTERLISYAASFGNYPASWGLGPEWSERLQNFDAISVRDENSYHLIKNAMGLEPELVLDPCLQFPVVPDPRDLNFFKSPYIAVYGHNFSEWYIRQIRRYAASCKLPLISIGYRNDWADAQWIAADPHDFVHFMAGATAVATNFFHGCVFALRNGKPFVCETSHYRSYKLHGLISKVGAEPHLVTEETPTGIYKERLSHGINSEIMQRIEGLRQRSHAYLDRALTAKQLQVA
jgi:hypothetical protein